MQSFQRKYDVEEASLPRKRKALASLKLDLVRVTTIAQAKAKSMLNVLSVQLKRDSTNQVIEY